MWTTTENTSIKLGGVFNDSFDAVILKNINGGDPAVYIDDLFGGKVIKQESTKAIFIDKDGNVKEGRTAIKPIHGKKYVLREEIEE